MEPTIINFNLQQHIYELFITFFHRYSKYTYANEKCLIPEIATLLELKMEILVEKKLLKSKSFQEKLGFLGFFANVLDLECFWKVKIKHGVEKNVVKY